jgi:hypothetical protein
MTRNQRWRGLLIVLGLVLSSTSVMAAFRANIGRGILLSVLVLGLGIWISLQWLSEVWDTPRGENADRPDSLVSRQVFWTLGGIVVGNLLVLGVMLGLDEMSLVNRNMVKEIAIVLSASILIFLTARYIVQAKRRQ